MNDSSITAAYYVGDKTFQLEDDLEPSQVDSQDEVASQETPVIVIGELIIK